MIRLQMKNCNMILTEKQQKYQHNHFGKLKKNEYLTGDEIFPSNQKEIIKQAKSKYSPLAKSFKK